MRKALLTLLVAVGLVMFTVGCEKKDDGKGNAPAPANAAAATEPDANDTP